MEVTAPPDGHRPHPHGEIGRRRHDGRPLGDPPEEAVPAGAAAGLGPVPGLPRERQIAGSRGGRHRARHGGGRRRGETGAAPPFGRQPGSARPYGGARRPKGKTA